MNLLALTRGDPSGVGLEIACKAWLRREEVPPFLFVADIEWCRRAAADLGLPVAFAEATPDDAATLFSTALPVLSCLPAARGMPGRPDIADAPGTIAAMERAVELTAQGRTAAVVTLPVSKEVLHKVGFTHPGQTEFMGELAARHFGTRGRAVMLLWSPMLAVVPVTIHVPVSTVPSLLTEELIAATVHVVAHDMSRRFGLPQPRIAVAGLNPHAGENGDIGREELDTIGPALERLRAQGLAVTGPHPADTLFHAAARARYDVALTMLHDQALIPVKTLAFDSAVNCTLGLPFVRTSPDHGTAFDIAGKGMADPTSLIAALNLAGRLAQADARA